jgi:hypothetical protein
MRISLHVARDVNGTRRAEADQRATANYRPVCIPDSSHLSRPSVLVLAEREGPERKWQGLGAASYMYDGQPQRPISPQQHGGHPLPITQPPGFLEFCLHPGCRLHLSGLAAVPLSIFSTSPRCPSTSSPISRTREDKPSVASPKRWQDADSQSTEEGVHLSCLTGPDPAPEPQGVFPWRNSCPPIRRSRSSTL